MKPIWIVDDDESIRWVLEKALARENLTTKSFSNARDAIEALQTNTPQVLVSDIHAGFLALSCCKPSAKFCVPVINILRFFRPDSVAAFQGGAEHWPFDRQGGRTVRALESARGVVSSLRRDVEILGWGTAGKTCAIGRLSYRMTVLITGESGTGKNHRTRLHKHSPRRSRSSPQYRAIPKDGWSQLFGNERAHLSAPGIAPRTFRTGRRRHLVPR